MDSISGHDFLPSYFLMPLIISTRCCKVNLFFPTADAVLAVGFDPKTGISEGLVLFSILSGDFWWGKKFCDFPHVFTWEAERGSIKAGGSINESSIKAGATVTGFLSPNSSAIVTAIL